MSVAGTPKTTLNPARAPDTKIWQNPHAPSLDNPILRAEKPKLLEIQLGNLCDMKCLYCWRGNSSRWASEDFENGIIDSDEYQTLMRDHDENFKSVFWEWYDSVAKDVEILSLLGGEPTKYLGFWRMLDRVHEGAKRAGNEKLKIRIVTNLNCSADTVIKLCRSLEKLDREGRRVLLDVSLEASGTMAEKIRQGLSWQTLVYNIDQVLSLKLKHLHFAFLPSINALSVVPFGDFLNFVRDLGQRYERSIPLLKNAVNKPTWLHPAILTPSFRVYFDEAITLLNEASEQHFPEEQRIWGPSWHLYGEFLRDIQGAIRFEFDSAPQELSKDRVAFAREMQRVAKLRGYDFAAEFPAYADFFKSCQRVDPKNPPDATLSDFSKSL